MLPALLLVAALATTPTPPDPLAGAIEHFRSVESYRVTIRSVHASGEEHIRYFYKKPGYVRMEFIHPHEGAVMIFNPNTGRVRLWPLGMGSFIEISLSPDNSIIRSLSGMRIDHSDIGTLFENIRLLRDKGHIEVLGEETTNGRTLVHFLVTGADGQDVAGVHSSEMWLDTANLFPARVTSRDLRGNIIESVQMEGLELNERLPEFLFDP